MSNARAAAAEMWAERNDRTKSALSAMYQIRRVIDTPTIDTITVGTGEEDSPDSWTIKRPLSVPASPGDNVLTITVANRKDSGTEYAIANLTRGINNEVLLRELIRDTIADALIAGSGILLTVDDGADTITIEATGGGGGAFAAYEDSTLIDGSVTKLRAWEGIVATLAAAGDVRFSVGYAGSGGNNGTSSAVARADHAHSGVYQPADNKLTDIAGLAEPGTDYIFFWDGSALLVQALTLGTNLSITGTTLNATGGGGAPTTATYIVQTPDGTLSNEQALSALATGLLKVTTGTGVLSTATAADLPNVIGAGDFRVEDTRFLIQDNTDPTKQARIGASNITAGAIRNFELPPGGAANLVGADSTQNIQNKTLDGTNVIAQAAVTNLVTDLGNKQPLDADLTTIAGLTATTDNVIQSVAGSWASRTMAQFKTTLAMAMSDVSGLVAALAAKLDSSWTRNVRLGTAVNSTIVTAADVTGFSISLGASEMWAFDIMILTGCSGTGGVKFGITMTGGYSLSCQQHGTKGSLTTFESNRTDTSGVLGVAFNTVATQTGFVRISGTCGSGVATTFQLQIAAGTAGQTATARVGSYLIAHRIS